MKSILFRGAVSVMAIFIPVTSSYALTTLEGEKFYAPSSLFNSSGWSYTGNLPSSLNAGFKAKNIDAPVEVCLPFIGCASVGGDQQYATGSRSITTTGAGDTPTLTPAYSLAFRGEFEGESFEAWKDSLLDQSLGKKFHSDVDSVEFLSPGSEVTDEHPIPLDWRSLNGYANPTGSYAKFDNTFSLSRPYLNAGESGCPQSAGHCRYTESFFKGGANLEANIQGSGSIENDFPLVTQSVSIDTKANRITTFKVNDDPIYTSTIKGNQSVFSLEEEKLKSIDFSFSGVANFLTETVSLDLGAGFEWEGKNEAEGFDISYVQRVEVPSLNVGSESIFTVEVRDDPQLTAGIEGNRFKKAKVLASTGLSAIDAVFKPVFEPVASGRLSVSEAEVTNEARLLKIPDNGFIDDHFFRFNIKIENDGFMDITVDDMIISVFEDDLFGDDPLLEDDFKKENLGLLLSPGEFFKYAFITQITADKLNNASSFFDPEFGYLELAATGNFGFTDTFGTRNTGQFNVNFVPEPNALVLILMGLFLTLTINNKEYKKDHRVETVQG